MKNVIRILYIKLNSIDRIEQVLGIILISMFSFSTFFILNLIYLKSTTVWMNITTFIIGFFSYIISTFLINKDEIIFFNNIINKKDFLNIYEKTLLLYNVIPIVIYCLIIFYINPFYINSFFFGVLSCNSLYMYSIKYKKRISFLYLTIMVDIIYMIIYLFISFSKVSLIFLWFFNLILFIVLLLKDIDYNFLLNDEKSKGTTKNIYLLKKLKNNFLLIYKEITLIYINHIYILVSTSIYMISIIIMFKYGNNLKELPLFLSLLLVIAFNDTYTLNSFGIEKKYIDWLRLSKYSLKKIVIVKFIFYYILCNIPITAFYIFSSLYLNNFSIQIFIFLLNWSSNFFIIIFILSLKYSTNSTSYYCVNNKIIFLEILIVISSLIIFVLLYIENNFFIVNISLSIFLIIYLRRQVKNWIKKR